MYLVSFGFLLVFCGAFPVLQGRPQPRKVAWWSVGRVGHTWGMPRSGILLPW